jgi:Raf kinase inhibitor-like YbhB/YbcL family protein
MLEKLPEIVGHALRGQRAGLDQTACRALDLRAGTAVIALRSPAFVDHGPLPVPFTADGDGLSPPLEWRGVPAAARALLLLVEDADSPTPHPFVHAIVAGLAPADGSLAQGALPSPDHDGEAGLNVGRNSYLQAAWLPPDPPPGHGVHRYVFQLFALEEAPDFGEAPGREAVLEALQAHAIASGWVIGTYGRADGSIRDEAGAEAAAEPDVLPSALPT